MSCVPVRAGPALAGSVCVGWLLARCATWHRCFLLGKLTCTRVVGTSRKFVQQQINTLLHLPYASRRPDYSYRIGGIELDIPSTITSINTSYNFT